MLPLNHARSSAWLGRAHRPTNITLSPLPSKCPELNPVENVWQFIRENWLSNRIFKYAATLNHCCFAWNRLVHQPVAHLVHRAAIMATCVTIGGTWYQTSITLES